MVTITIQGKQVVYDWPGFNNGNPNLVRVKAMIIVKPTSELKKAVPLSECKGEDLKNELLAILVTYLIPVAIFLVLWVKYKHKMSRRT